MQVDNSFWPAECLFSVGRNRSANFVVCSSLLSAGISMYQILWYMLCATILFFCQTCKHLSSLFQIARIHFIKLPVITTLLIFCLQSRLQIQSPGSWTETWITLANGHYCSLIHVKFHLSLHCQDVSFLLEHLTNLNSFHQLKQITLIS